MGYEEAPSLQKRLEEGNRSDVWFEFRMGIWVRNR